MKLNWVTPVAIETDGTYTLRPSELYPDIYMISAPYPSGEYLLLEVRRPLLFDNNLWQPGGLLIYHIDDNAAGPGNQVRGFPGVSGWPGNGAHYVAALLQSDGAYGLEQAIDNGHLDDFWTAGKTLGPGNGEQVVDSANYPNTDSYSAGIQVTGLIITNFVDGDDGSVSFDVSGLAPSTGEEPSSTFPPGPSPTDGGTTDSGSGGGTGGGWPTLSPVDNSPTDGESTNEGEPAEDNGSPTDGTGSEGSSASTKSFSFVVGSFLALWSSFWIE